MSDVKLYIDRACGPFEPSAARVARQAIDDLAKLRGTLLHIATSKKINQLEIEIVLKETDYRHE